jgi:hypothetical protein
LNFDIIFIFYQLTLKAISKQFKALLASPAESSANNQYLRQKFLYDNYQVLSYQLMFG